VTLLLGHLRGDVEGLTLYTTSRGRGYLIAASQGNGQFIISQRAGSNGYVLPFTGVAAGGRDPVTHPDGIDVTSQTLGAAFAQRVFVTQDHQDDRDHQNCQRGPGPALARALRPPPHTKPEPLHSRRTRVGSFHLSPATSSVSQTSLCETPQVFQILSPSNASSPVSGLISKT